VTTQAPDTEVLIPETPEAPSAPAVPDPPPAGSRCRHRYKNGKRCRLPGLQSQSGLCGHHFRQSLAAALPKFPSDSDDLSAELLPGRTHFSRSEDLREFLSRLLVLTAEGRVSPRRAAVLAYITNQLLHSHCVVQKEEKEEELENQAEQFLLNLPRPKRDSADAMDRTTP